MSARTKVVLTLSFLAVIFIVILAHSSVERANAQWVEPDLPYDMVSWNDLFERELLDPGDGSDDEVESHGERKEQEGKEETRTSPAKTRSFWLNTRCYPNTPNRKPDYNLLKGDFNRDKGWVMSNYDLENDARDVDEKIMAVYRDILRLSVRAVDIWVYPNNSNPCDEQPVWVSMGSAIALHQMGDKMIWATADHISYLEEYTGYYRGALQIHGTDAIALPRQPDFRVGIMITPIVPAVIPLTSLFSSYYNNNLPSLFYPIEDLIVGQKVYQPFTTIGYDCLPTVLDVERCVVTYPQVNTGTISGVVPKYGEMGATFTAQLDIMGGASGSPTFVYIDNGDDLISGADFRMIGVANTGWTSGNGGFQGMTYEDLRLVIDYVEGLEEIWN